MTVLYRITSIPSSNPPPILKDDKDTLNKLCLDSFINAFSDIKPKVIFLADHVNDYSYLESFPWEHEIIKTTDGQNKSMLNSYEIASKVDDYVLFNECDHYYLPNSGKLILESIKELGLVSAYDHPDFYSRFDIHPRETEIRIVDNHHFRKSARNVMSWGCHSKLVKENIDILNSHGYLDDQVWIDLRKNGHQLWTAIPSLSTHMVRDYMAPSINWEKFFV